MVISVFYQIINQNFNYMLLFFYPSSLSRFLPNVIKSKLNELPGITKHFAKFTNIFQANKTFFSHIKVLSASASDLART